MRILSYKSKNPKTYHQTYFDPSVASVELKNGKIDAALIDVSLLNIFKKDEKF